MPARTALEGAIAEVGNRIAYVGGEARITKRPMTQRDIFSWIPPHRPRVILMVEST